MDNKALALASSFIAMSLIVISYFVRKKEKYLLFQLLGILFLIASYFFSVDWLAMIGMIVGACRTVTFFLYERKGDKASILWAFLFSFLSLASFFIINAKTGAGVKVEDILLLISLIGYAFIFRVRSLKVVRFTMFVPLSLSVLYNILAAAPLFTVLSYSFELGANIVSVFKYHVFGKKEKTPSAAKEVNYG